MENLELLFFVLFSTTKEKYLDGSLSMLSMYVSVFISRYCITIRTVEMGIFFHRKISTNAFNTKYFTLIGNGYNFK